MSKGGSTLTFALAALALSQARVTWGAAQATVQEPRMASLTESAEVDDYEEPPFESFIGEGSRYRHANTAEREELFARVEATGHICSNSPSGGPRLNDALRLGRGRWLLSVESGCYLGYHALIHFLVVTEDRVRPASFVTPWPAVRYGYNVDEDVYSPAAWMRASRDGAWLYEHEGRVRLRALDCGRALCDIGVLDTYEWRAGRFVQLTRKERDAAYDHRVPFPMIGDATVAWPITEPRAKRCLPRVELQSDGRGRLSAVGPRAVLHQVSFDVTQRGCEGTEWNTIRCDSEVEYQAIGVEDDWVVVRVNGWDGPNAEVARLPRGCSIED